MALIFTLPHLHSVVRGSSLGRYSSSVSTVHGKQKWDLLSVMPAGCEFPGEPQRVCCRAVHQSPHAPRGPGESKGRAVRLSSAGGTRGPREPLTPDEARDPMSLPADQLCDRAQLPGLCSLRFLSCNPAGDPSLLTSIARTTMRFGTNSIPIMQPYITVA